VLSNAAKFTEAGTITVRAGIDDEALRVEVEDTGIGISANDLPTIFDEFQQVDSSSTRRFGGTGLGLAITRKLCRLMGGEVEVRSTPNVGSCFTICLPRVGAPSDTDRGQSAATRGAAVIGAVTPTKPVPQA
jgi:signal transduction histidine kinase